METAQSDATPKECGPWQAGKGKTQVLALILQEGTGALTP